MPDPIHEYRYAHSAAREGLRIGVARHLPRGVRKADYATRGYFDLWLPTLAPSPELVARYRHKEINYKSFARTYRREMTKVEPRAAIELLARLSCFQPIALGCFCEDPARCHRSVLQDLVGHARDDLLKASAGQSDPPEDFGQYASPACYLSDFEDED